MIDNKGEKHFFPHDNDSQKGDYVQRVVDPRQAYYCAKPGPAPKSDEKQKK